MLSHFPPTYIMGFDLQVIHQKFKPHARTHHVDIVTMLNLCYSIMSHATLITYDHASMSTLHTSVISRALWLPQKHMMLGRLECSCHGGAH